jgi:hypothetical protein
MSNPGVILLAEHKKSGGCFEKLRIEDNLGESIHIHLDDFRIDLTINEYQSFSELIWQALVELDDLPNELETSNFLSDIYKAVSYQQPILTQKKLKLEKLKFIKRSSWLRFFYLYKLVNIEQTPQFLFLTGKSKEYERYPQKNYLGINNIDRLTRRSVGVLEDNTSAAIIFGNQSLVIRDGMHLCSLLAYKYGVMSKVNVIRVVNVDLRNKLNHGIIWSLKNIISSTYFIKRRFLIIFLRKILSYR